SPLARPSVPGSSLNSSRPVAQSLISSNSLLSTRSLAEADRVGTSGRDRIGRDRGRDPENNPVAPDTSRGPSSHAAVSGTVDHRLGGGDRPRSTRRNRRQLQPEVLR